MAQLGVRSELLGVRMPYLVQELPKGDPEQQNWRDIHQSKLTIGNSPPYSLSLLLQSKQSTLSDVLSLFCCGCLAQRQQQDSRVVLHQQDHDDEGQVTREIFFQLCEGYLEHCRVEMQGVDTFLKIVLFHGQTNVSLGLLQDLIKPYGPVGMEELVEVVVRWDIDGSLEHEHFQQYIKHGKKLRRGKTLLKCAIEKGRIRLTKKMLSITESEKLTECACAESELDEEKNNLFHLAARAGQKNTMIALIKHRQITGLPLQNSEEESPSKMTSLRVLSRVGSLDDEESIVLLNQYNLLGDTPLALATKEGHFDIVLSLLLVNADPNIGNATTGYTPLHVAATMGYVNIIKALLVFGADIAVKDRHGKTAVDRAVASDYPEAVKCFTDFTDAVEIGKTEVKFAYPQEMENTEPFLLCMDGGGTRGLATCVLLRELEDRVRKSDPNFVTLASYFDYVTGTSIGSYIAFSLAYRRLAMIDIMKLCFEFKDTILCYRRPYPEEKVIDALQHLFTEDTLMSAVVEPKVMALTCKADTSPPTLHIMRNTGEARNGEKGPDELKVWEAARASSAAPTYFPPYGKFLDGGILANNPTVDCIAEVIDDLVAEKREPRLGLVVSVGTGSSPHSEIDPINIPSISSPKDILAGVVGVMNFLILMLDQMTHAGGSQVARSRAWCTSMKSPYFRLDPTLDVKVDLGEIDEEKLVDLMFKALLCAKRESQQLDAVAKILLSRPPRD